jgi:IS5 family transposase
MAGLAILKHTFNLSDEELCARWVENPYFQFFCGETFFRHDLPFDRTSMTRWRQRMVEERIMSLRQESLSAAVKTGAMRPEDTRPVIVDTTVQPKNIMFPTDAKLLNQARERLVTLAKKTGLDLRQSYVRVGKFALIGTSATPMPSSSSAPTGRFAPSGPISAAPSAISPARSRARTICRISSARTCTSPAGC